MGFNNANPPKRAGDYNRFLVQRAATLPISSGATVLVPIVDDWGPFKVATPCLSFQEYLQKFGQPLDPVNPSPGYIAAYNAFKGEGADAPGAGQVIFYRMGAAAAAKASKGLAAGATPTAITFTAKYEGVRGNNYRVAVIANAINPATAMDVEFYDGLTLVEAYRNYTSAQITTLQADVIRLSKLFTASGAINGTKLDALAAAAFTGGNSGSTLVAGDWTAMMTAVEPLLTNVGVMAPYDLTDPTILASLVAWAKNLNKAEKSRRFFLVTGGVAAEVLSAASTRAAAANDENIITWGIGTYRDNILGLNLSTSQLATRLAGIVSSRQGQSSLTFARLDDLSIIVGPSESDVLASLNSGFIVATLGVSGVQLEAGRTTYTVTTDVDKPFEIYSRPKYVFTMQDFERENKAANEAGNKIGKLPVNNDTREDLVADANKRLGVRIERNEIQARDKNGNASRVVLASDPPPSDNDEFVALDWFGAFGRSLEQTRNSFYIS